MSDKPKIKDHLTGYDLAHLGEFVKALNTLAREHGVDLAPYGPISIVAGEAHNMALSLDREGDGPLVIRQPL